MKNKFLLLGATALILISKNVFAEGEITYPVVSDNSVNMEASVTIIPESTMTKLKDLDFGIVGYKTQITANYGEHEEESEVMAGTLTLSSDGTPTPDNLQYFGRAHPGQVRVSGILDQAVLGLPEGEEGVPLTYKEGNATYLCGTVNDFEYTGSDSGGIGTYNIGAKFYLNNALGGYDLIRASGHKCTGNFTVTYIIPDESV